VAFRNFTRRRHHSTNPSAIGIGASSDKQILAEAVRRD
jgi:hypothetical protein